VHVVIPTHTTRHLDTCLACMAWQARPADTVVVSSDTDDPAIPALLSRCWPRIAAACKGRPPRLVYTARPFQQHARLNQVRNNALRALDQTAQPRSYDTVVVLDGDTVLGADAILRHWELSELGFELIIPYRINLDRARTSSLDLERLLRVAAAAGDPLAGLATQEEWQSLADRHRRYVRHLRLRAAPLPGIPKAHKPKILGGHHAVSVRCLRAVNGYDEQYIGYGYDDDDLARRLHALEPSPRTAIAVGDIMAYHLWHPSRAPKRPTEAPGYERFSRSDLPLQAEHGWTNPMPQPKPVVRTIAASEHAATHA
jgi:hypothetical protein